ncbi:hypothetical protein EVAR_15116_1 [Eumeta japonica]|uniref:Transposable element P transposase-like RNase H domain-containing protein n=1 Tax=Eumeta variegata TaxID=151549 RepID=A0A4C1UHY4_EUMVA|nr:hypothetical protein EVAR_15116_1 [Eumeta japonica]
MTVNLVRDGKRFRPYVNNVVKRIETIQKGAIAAQQCKHQPGDIKKALAKWYQNIEFTGFTEEALVVLNQRASGRNLICFLTADEMAIRQQSNWDVRQNHGFVDLGTESNGQIMSRKKKISEEEAKLKRKSMIGSVGRK